MGNYIERLHLADNHLLAAESALIRARQNRDHVIYDMRTEGGYTVNQIVQLTGISAVHIRRIIHRAQKKHN